MTRKQKIPRDGTSVDEKESGQQMSLLLRVLCHGIGSPTTVIDLSTVVLVLIQIRERLGSREIERLRKMKLATCV